MAQATDLSLEERVAALEALVAAQRDPVAPLWMQNVAYPAQKDRQLIRAVWPQQGVLSGLQVMPREQGANLTVDVTAGQAVIAGTDAPFQGNYLWTLDSRTNFPLAAPPGAGTVRADLVVLRVNDDAVIGDTGRPRAQIEIIGGTPGASAIVPTAPPSSIPLAEIGPIALDTAQITTGLISDRRRFLGVGPQVLYDALYQVPQHLEAPQLVWTYRTILSINRAFSTPTLLEVWVAMTWGNSARTTNAFFNVMLTDPRTTLFGGLDRYPLDAAQPRRNSTYAAMRRSANQPYTSIEIGWVGDNANVWIYQGSLVRARITEDSYVS